MRPFAALSFLVACALAAATPVTTAAIHLDGLGDLHHPVTTRSAEAQQFFDQGLRLIYAFNHAEAVRSFREAVRLDPHCAMGFWGIAVALGPNYNMGTDAEGEKNAREAIGRALALELSVTPAERDYIEAAAKRYAGPPTADRRQLDQDYATAMRQVAKHHPEDDDAQVLFAESMMDLAPWALWQKSGLPAPGTEEIVATLERVLDRNPRHPGANHYYVHAQEGGPHPEKALACADRLPSLMPGAGHIVHMPSHIYIHTGQWKQASDVNEAAIAADKAYLAKASPEGVYPMMYVAHNFDFLWVTASMEGRSAVALKAAREMVAPFSEPMVREMEKTMPGIDSVLATPLLAEVRFGRWEAVLAEPAPPAEFRYQAALRHFGRGMAFARTGKIDEARREQQALAGFVAALKSDEMVSPLNSAKAVYQVAVKLLAGEIEAADHHPAQAEALEEEAIGAEDALGYDEPPPWPLPTRQYLGALLMSQQKPADAARYYREDLKKYPENGWSLWGLSKSAQGEEAVDAAARFSKQWSRSDVTLTASRF